MSPRRGIAGGGKLKAWAPGYLPSCPLIWRISASAVKPLAVANSPGLQGHEEEAVVGGLHLGDEAVAHDGVVALDPGSLRKQAFDFLADLRGTLQRGAIEGSWTFMKK